MRIQDSRSSGGGGGGGGEEKKAEEERKPSSKEMNGFRQQVEIMYREGGVKAFYAGFEACIYATVVQQAVYYQMFGWFNRLHGITRQQTPHPLWGLLVGAEAGVMTVLLTNPFWVINSRQATLRSDKIEGWWQTVCRIYREEGVRGLQSGLVPALLLVLNPSFLFFFYTLLTRVLESRRSGKRSLTDYFLLGLLSKLLATLVVFPFFTIKIQLQKSSANSNTSFLAIAQKMYEKGGVAGSGVGSPQSFCKLASPLRFFSSLVRDYKTMLTHKNT